jgi:hypothetical protein
MANRLEELERQRKALAAEIRKAKREQQRRERERQLQTEAVIGRLVCEAMTREPDSDYAAWVNALIAEKLTSVKERVLFESPGATDAKTSADRSSDTSNNQGEDDAAQPVSPDDPASPSSAQTRDAFMGMAQPAGKTSTG